MKIIKRKKIITIKVRTFYFDDGFKYDADDIYDLLDDLVDTSMAGNKVVISDKELREHLEKLNVINSSVRGSSWQGSEYNSFYDKFIKLYNKENK